MSNTMIKFRIDGNCKLLKKLNINSNLTEIRQMIKQKIIIPSVFLDLHECEIEKEDENEIWLKDVIKME